MLVCEIAEESSYNFEPSDGIHRLELHVFKADEKCRERYTTRLQRYNRLVARFRESDFLLNPATPK